ncbi:MAG: hypothetical protein J3K34DRAFT_417898 [Monoraphidium minutum]|nr:MAG: hypothetical protein J3K34DRAFT_417898 [Monoraphidium minutum]
MCVLRAPRSGPRRHHTRPGRLGPHTHPGPRPRLLPPHLSAPPSNAFARNKDPAPQRCDCQGVSLPRTWHCRSFAPACGGGGGAPRPHTPPSCPDKLRVAPHVRPRSAGAGGCRRALTLLRAGRAFCAPRCSWWGREQSPPHGVRPIPRAAGVSARLMRRRPSQAGALGCTPAAPSRTLQPANPDTRPLAIRRDDCAALVCRRHPPAPPSLACRWAQLRAAHAQPHTPTRR